MASLVIIAASTGCALTLLWMLHTLYSPYITCWRCKGSGSRSSLLRGESECVRCRGRGKQLRGSRRLINWIQREYRSGTRNNKERF